MTNLMEDLIKRGVLKIVIIKKKTIFIILILVFIIGIIAIGDIPQKIQKLIYIKEYTEQVEKYSNEYQVDTDLIYAVIKAESNFNPNAKSSKNAIGLMQLMEETAKDLMKRVNLKIADEELKNKLYDVDININLGTKYLSILLERYENIEIAVTAYNAGIGTVDNWIEKGIIKSDGSNIENIPYKETNNYVRKILRDYKIYKNLE
ncbi:MAG: lytic transglycosylase domain-containing protein [Clostridia bacterium]|nr:lytic transglycosylase domain-containing protein [Clostridia bacterium]